MTMLGRPLSNFTVYDGEYEIIFSEVFNLYEGSLKIKNLLPELTLEFNFLDDIENKSSHFEGKTDLIKKIFIFDFYNFKNPFGVGTTKPVEISSIKEKIAGVSVDKKMFISLMARTLSSETSFLQVTITLYKK